MDLSAKFLGVGKTNFTANGLPPENYEFFASESLQFLQGALKRKRTFDLIICDPPSFGRTQKGVFRLEDDFENLVKACWDCLAQDGRLLFSSNFEKWNQDEFYRKLQRSLPKAKVTLARSGLDFEWPDEEKLLKGFWVTK